MSHEIILSISHVRKLYSSQFGIQDLSFDVYKGEFLSILGPSGGGKSTLLQLIAGLISPEQGEIRICDKVVSSANVMVEPEKRGVNMVFQNYALWPHMNVFDHLVYGLKRQRLTKEQRNEKVRSLLELLELQGLEKRLPAQLSGGQQQRVAIARALSTNPSILLLDEPMSNLDGYLRLQMRTKLKTMFKQLGTTVLYVTHDPEEALAMADRLLILKGGYLEQLDTPQACYLEPATPWVAGLLGAINRTTSGKAAVANDRVFLVGFQTLQALNPPHPNKSIMSGQRVELRSRPEDITLHLEEPSLPPNYSLNRPIVLNSGFEGKYWRITLLNEPDILFYALHDSYIEPGTRVWAICESKHIYVYPIDEKEDI